MELLLLPRGKWERESKQLRPDPSISHPSLQSPWLASLVSRSVPAECPNGVYGGESALGFFKMADCRGPYLRRNDYNGLALRLRSGLRQHKRGMRGILQAHLPFWPSLALFEIETSTWPRAPPFRLDPLVVLAIYSIALEYLIWFLGIGLTARGLTANLTWPSAQV